MQRLVSEETGAGMLEYAVLVGVIAIGAIMALQGLAQAVGISFYNGAAKVAPYWPGW